MSKNANWNERSARERSSSCDEIDAFPDASDRPLNKRLARFYPHRSSVKSRGNTECAKQQTSCRVVQLPHRSDGRRLMGTGRSTYSDFGDNGMIRGRFLCLLAAGKRRFDWHRANVLSRDYSIENWQLNETIIIVIGGNTRARTHHANHKSPMSARRTLPRIVIYVLNDRANRLASLSTAIDCQNFRDFSHRFLAACWDTKLMRAYREQLVNV